MHVMFHEKGYVWVWTSSTCNSATPSLFHKYSISLPLSPPSLSPPPPFPSSQPSHLTFPSPGHFPMNISFKMSPPTCAVLKGLCNAEGDGQREVSLECVVAALGVPGVDTAERVM